MEKRAQPLTSAPFFGNNEDTKRSPKTHRGKHHADISRFGLYLFVFRCLGIEHLIISLSPFFALTGL